MGDIFTVGNFALSPSWHWYPFALADFASVSGHLLGKICQINYFFRVLKRGCRLGFEAKMRENLIFFRFLSVHKLCPFNSVRPLQI